MNNEQLRENGAIEIATNIEEEETKATCIECGCELEEDEAICVEQDTYCQDCYDERYCECYECGERIDKNVDDYCQDYDGEYYCEQCRDDYLFYCDNCSEWKRQDDGVCMQDTGNWYCQDCADRDYYCCNDCGDYYEDESEGIYTHDGQFICHNCADNYYVCNGCDEYYHESELAYNEADDCYYCEGCYDEHASDARIYSYHDFSDWQFYKNDDEKKPPFYIGYELEIETPNNESQHNCVDLVYNNLNAVCMHDGSLGNYGVEIISHPQTYKYIMKHKDVMKETFKKLEESGARSHDTTTCGLHFHVSRPDDDTINKIWLVMETYKDELIAFSRRRAEQQTHWASFLSDEGLSDDECQALYYIKKCKGDFDRYMALNLNNNNTIEFRLFKGTLNFDTFIASIELVNNIVKLCSNKNLDVTKINWQMITNTPFCKKYCQSRNITSNKKIKDYSMKYLKQENKRKNIAFKILKSLEPIAIETYRDTMRFIKKDATIEQLKSCFDYSVNNYCNVRDVLSAIDDLKYYCSNNNFEWESIKSFVKNRVVNLMMMDADTKTKILELIKKGDDVKCV